MHTPHQQQIRYFGATPFVTQEQHQIYRLKNKWIGSDAGPRPDESHSQHLCRIHFTAQVQIPKGPPYS